MEISNEELKAFQANLFMKSLPEPISYRLLADREFTARLGISVQSTLHLTTTTQITADELVKAAKAVLAGEAELEISTKDKRKLRFKGELSDGSLILTGEGNQVFEYEYIEVLSPESKARQAAMERLLANTLISAPRADLWRERMTRELTPTELVDLLKDIQATPESLAERIHALPKLSRNTMVPDDPGYWSTLLPLHENEPFAIYVEKTLAPHQLRMLNLNRNLACSRIAYTAVSQSVLLTNQMASLVPDDFGICLRKGDPFSLIFAFEVAAQNILDGSEWERVGTEALSKLFSSREDLDKRCQLAAAGVIIACAGLARVSIWKSAPLYWRRLTALSHAAVLSDVLSGMQQPEAFLKWTSNHLSAEYHWRALMDRREGPLWWPEAIEPGAVKARICARFLNAMHRLEEDKWPTQWKSLVEDFADKFLNPTESVLMSFPGPFADFTDYQRTIEVSLFEKTIEALKTLPHGIPGLMPFVHLPQLTELEINALKDFVARSELPMGTASQTYLAELGRIAHAAGVYRNAPLADALAEKALQLFSRADPAVSEAATVIIVDAANAFADEIASLTWLAMWFERLAAVASTLEETKLLANVLALISSAEPKCQVYLSSARATLDIKLSRQKLASDLVSAG